MLLSEIGRPDPKEPIWGDAWEVVPFGWVVMNLHPDREYLTWDRHEHERVLTHLTEDGL